MLAGGLLWLVSAVITNTSTIGSYNKVFADLQAADKALLIRMEQHDELTKEQNQHWLALENRVRELEFQIRYGTLKPTSPP